MTRLLPSLLLVFAALGSASCGGGDTPEKHAQDTVAVMRSLVEVLAQIQDPASAEKAKPQLEELSGELRALKERAEQLGSPDDPAAREARKEIGREAGMNEVIALFMQQQQRLAQSPELMAVVQPVMAAMGGVDG